MTEQNVDIMLHNLLMAMFVVVIIAVIVSFLRGLLFLRNAVRRKDFDMALAILVALYAFVMMFLSDDYFLWNYLVIGWIALLLVFIGKVYFGEIILKGTLSQKIMLVVGILVIIAALLLGKYFPLPEWMQYIPAI